jgi:hypothetical protein
LNAWHGARSCWKKAFTDAPSFLNFCNYSALKLECTLYYSALHQQVSSDNCHGTKNSLKIYFNRCFVACCMWCGDTLSPADLLTLVTLKPWIRSEFNQKRELSSSL